MSRAGPRTAAMLALCGPAWLLGGWIVETLGLPEFGLLARAGAVLAALCVAETAWQRLRPSEGEHDA